MLRKNFILLLPVMFLLTISAHAQNSMGVGTTTPNPNAVLDLVSPTNNQGLLVPRMTTVQRTDAGFTGNLTASDNGLMVFDSDEGQFYFWFSGSWQAVRNLNAGDMSTTTYDTDLDGKTDSAQYALVAGSLDGFTVESSVPAGAVFTDNQAAIDVAVTPGSGVISTDVQSALVELQNEIVSAGGGDMTTDIYDINGDGVVDNAELVNGLTVESAVPVAAVFTDNQVAADVAFTPAGNIVATDVQGALQELDTDISGITTNAMQTSTYDVDVNGIVDLAEAADSLSTTFIDGVTLAYNFGSNVLEVRNNAITAAKIANGAVTADKIGVTASEGNALVFSGGVWNAGQYQWADLAGVPADVLDGDNQNLSGVLTIGNGAGGLAITNLADPVNLQDAATRNYVDNELASLTASGIFYDPTITGLLASSTVQEAIDEVAGLSTPWFFSGSDLYYDLGNVGFGTTNPLSTIQVSTNSHIMEDAGDLVIGNNVYGDGLGGFFYTLSDNGIITSISKAGGFEVLTVPSGTAGAPIGAPTSILSVNTSGNGGIPGTWSSDILEVGTSASFGGTNVVIDATTGNINSAGTYSGAISYDNVSSGLTASTVQGAIDEVAGQTTQWTTTGSDIYFSGGNVGIGTTTPLSPIQVNEFNYFRSDAVVFGEFIANNLYSDGSTVRYVNAGPSGAIFFADGGQIDFLVGSNQPANTDAISTTSVESVLQITADRDVNLFGGIEISAANTLTPNDGMLSFNGGRLQIHESGQFVNVTGLPVPYEEIALEDAGTLLSLRNDGLSTVANFAVNNASGGTALVVTTTSTTSPAVDVTGNTTLSNSTGAAANIISGAAGTPSLIVDHSQPASGNQIVQVQTEGITVASIDDQGTVLANAVGIGTNTPTVPLDVIGDIQVPAANEYLYSAPKTRVLSISNAAFTGSVEGPATRLANSGLYTFVGGSPAGTLGIIFAPVSLPDGARVQTLEATVYDNDATEDLTVQLVAVRLDPLNVGATVVGGVPASTTGQSLDYQLITYSLLNQIIDNTANVYHVEFRSRRANAELRVVGVRITYTVDHAD